MEYPVHEKLARPRLLVAYADSAYAARIARCFRRLGWEVHLAPTAAEARRLAEVYAPHTIVLELALPDESGWNACAHLTAAHPGQRVVLLAPERVDSLHERLHAAGASAFVTRGDGMESLVRAAYGHARAKAV